jgi:hypothetical protein
VLAALGSSHGPNEHKVAAHHSVMAGAARAKRVAVVLSRSIIKFWFWFGGLSVLMTSVFWGGASEFGRIGVMPPPGRREVRPLLAPVEQGGGSIQIPGSFLGPRPRLVKYASVLGLSLCLGECVFDLSSCLNADRMGSSQPCSCRACAMAAREPVNWCGGGVLWQVANMGFGLCYWGCGGWWSMRCELVCDVFLRLIETMDLFAAHLSRRIGARVVCVPFSQCPMPPLGMGARWKGEAMSTRPIVINDWRCVGRASISN